MIICWFYVKNCIFVHITDKIFPGNGSLSETSGPHYPPSGGARTAPEHNAPGRDHVDQQLKSDSESDRNDHEVQPAPGVAEVVLRRR